MLDHISNLDGTFHDACVEETIPTSLLLLDEHLPPNNPLGSYNYICTVIVIRDWLSNIGGTFYSAVVDISFRALAVAKHSATGPDGSLPGRWELGPR